MVVLPLSLMLFQLDLSRLKSTIENQWKSNVGKSVVGKQNGLVHVTSSPSGDHQNYGYHYQSQGILATIYFLIFNV